MNRNRKSRVASYGIAAGALAAVAAVGFGGADAQAAPLAGATAVVNTAVEEEAKDVNGGAVDTATTQHSTVAGANQEIADIIAETNAAKNEAQNEEAATPETPAEEQSNIGIANIDSYVNVRSGAGEDNQVVGMLYNNNAAEVVGEQDGWYEIQSGNVSGFVKADYLTVGDQAMIDEATDKTADVNTGTLYIRSEATTDSEVMGFAAGGDSLQVLDDSMSAEGWVKVATANGEGYVSADYVNLNNNMAYGETVEEYNNRVAAEEAARQQAAAEKAAAQRQSYKQTQQKTYTRPATQSRSTQSYSAPQQTYTAPAANGNGSSIVNYASQFVGNPYVYGGSSLTNGTDCSGFVMSVYASQGVSLPHSSSAMRSVGTSVSQSDMQPGDIVCYSGHVGIYAGNNTIVHASNPSSGIKYSNADYKQILDVRRVY